MGSQGIVGKESPPEAAAIAIPEGFISTDLIIVDLDADSQEDVVHDLAVLFHQKGYVCDGYAEAVLKREESFPTGLPTQDIQVAMPHTDVEYCFKSGVAVATLRHPVTWGEMASLDTFVEAEIVFLLSVASKHEQVQWLKRLIIMFGRPGVLRRIKESKSPQEIYDILAENLMREDEVYD